MLQLIIGSSGTGKTSRLDEIIGEKITGGEKCLLVVPEQYSFISEKRLYKKLGASSVLNLEVLSITRLCNSIFREFGGLSGISINDAARYMLMAMTIQQLESQLKTYKKSSTNMSFLDTIISTCSELKSAGITPEDLEESIEKVENENLRLKLDDILLLYSGYQALVETGYSDPEDDIMKAITILENNDFFKDYNVFFDGFTTFMSGEFQLVKHIISQSKSIFITLNTDILDCETDSGVFAIVKSTGQRLKKYSEELGIEFSDPTILPDNIKYKTPEIAYLSHNYDVSNTIYSDDAENIKVSSYSSSYDEILATAATIASLVQNENYNYDDIAVIARDPDAYNELFHLIYKSYEIPFFIDKRVDIENTPIILGITSALDCARSNFSSESVLALAKSPILNLSSEETSRLENYVYIWQIKGENWLSDFTGNPRGMSDIFTEKDKLYLEEINKTRKHIISPLSLLKDKISEGTGRSFALGIYNFLTEIGTPQNLVNYGNQLPDDIQDNFIEINGKVWDKLIEVIDIFAKVIGSSKLGFIRLIELFRLAVNSTDIGVLPQSLDQVIVGGADRIRPENIKAAFIIGANEGFFPSSVGSSGAFSATERQQLNNAGIEIGGTSLYQSLLENFYVYFALTVPSEKLFVSYSKFGTKGEELFPSNIVSSLKDIFPQVSENRLLPQDYIRNHNSAVSVLSRIFTSDIPLRATLNDIISSRNPDIIEKMNNSAWKPEHKLENISNISRFYGDSLYLSPSKVERFYKCKFAFFASDALKLKKRKKVEFSPLESGNAIHHILYVMLEKYGGKGLAKRSLQKLEDEVSEIIKEYIANRITYEEAVSKRMIFLFKRISSTMARLLAHIGSEFSQSLYEPVEFELEIKSSSDLKPLKLTTPNGTTVYVEGVVDRVDIMEKNGKKFLRVVDYKSGRKSFKLEDILQGLNLQLLLYLFTIAENGKDSLENAIPTGVLYMPVTDSYSSLERSTSEAQAKSKLAQNWKMNGILLDDPEILSGMEEDLAGIYIPAKVKKDGSFDSYSSVATTAQLGSIAVEVENQIKNMVEQIKGGEINNVPINSPDYPTCEYCEYRTICGFEDGDPVKIIEKMSKQEVFEKIGEDGEENEN